VTFGVVVAFIQYADRFYQPVRDLSDKYNVFQAAMVASERIFDLLDTTPGVPAPARPHEVGRLRGEVEFQNVWFAYKDEEWVLRDLSFRVAPGEKVAIVGATGAGKTTISNLLTRFYEFQKGSIRVDGVDLRDLDGKAIRRQIGLVLQDVFLFSGSVRDNIAFGARERDREEADRALAEVGGERLASRLPSGLDEEVGERGGYFSMGERQILAFARALHYDPSILILDEATSSVDIETERVIQAALRRLLTGRTSLVIAHRLSTVLDADRILVMHKGELREQGTHAELLTKGGIYARLYELQYARQRTAEAEPGGARAGAGGPAVPESADVSAERQAASAGENGDLIAELPGARGDEESS